MSKHTHTGTCQACGRHQAVNVKSQELARHGYNIQHGWQSGTCAGSEELPLELSRDFTDKTIASLTAQAESWAKATRDDIRSVSVKYRPDVDGRRGNERTSTYLDAAAFAAEFPGGHVPRWRSPTARWEGETFDDLRDQAAKVRRSQVPQILAHVRLLRDLIVFRFGQPLTAVAPALEELFDVVRREAGDYRGATAAVAELTSQGYKVTSRRAGWRQGGGWNIVGKRAKAPVAAA